MQLHRNHKQPGSDGKKTDRTPMPSFDGIGTFCREAPLPPQWRGGTLSAVFPPFTDPRADLVIKSRDGRKFRVHRAILDVASPTLLGSLIAEDSDTESSSPPVYRISESSAVVDALLRFCYPGRRPRFSLATEPESTAHFLSVLAALQRYAPAAADDLVATHWSSCAWREPFRFFFHAIARGLAPQAHTCAQLVAYGSGSAPNGLLELYVPEMEAVGALAYHRLLAYVHACREAALGTVRVCTWGPPPAPSPATSAKPGPDLGTRACVDGVQCVCAASARASWQTKPLPPAVLQLLLGELQGEPRGRVLLGNRAFVDAFAEAAHDALCVPEFYDYMPPSPLRVLVALAVGWWCWSFLVAAVVALAMGQVEVKCGCPKGKHIPWAEARIRDIAKRVDEAVSQVSVFCWRAILPMALTIVQVKLDLSGVFD